MRIWKRLNSRLTEFIEMTTRRDASAKSEIERAKKDFYTKYSYLKPECEKSRMEKIVDAMKKLGLVSGVRNTGSCSLQSLL